MSIVDMFKNAMNKMSGDVCEEYSTRKTKSSDINVGDSFLDIDCTVYNVERLKKEDGKTFVLARTKEQGKSDGWFTRDNYDVIVKD